MKVFVVDLSICNGCYNCQIACKDEHVGNDWTPYAKPQPLTGQFWFKMVERERGSYPKVKVSYIPTLCNHCDEAPCIPSCQFKAIYKRPDGLVLIDPLKCTGCRDCVYACPYGSIYFNENLMIAQKCTGCAHLVDKGDIPRCVDACPTEALKFCEEEEAKEILKQADLLRPELKQTKPRVYYLYLELLKPYIAGDVYDPEEDECIKEAKVKLIEEESGKTFETVTDHFGDFWFKGLERNKSFTLKIEKEGYSPVEIKNIKTEKDVVINDIKITKHS
jgi:Fe-S-cluster-containing dehydrogenase component